MRHSFLRIELHRKFNISKPPLRQNQTNQRDKARCADIIKRVTYGEPLMTNCQKMIW